MMRRSICWAGAAMLTAPSLAAQSTLPRDFERVHFARREAALDRAFAAASTRIRDEAMRKIRHAVEFRGWADSLAATRAIRLAVLVDRAGRELPIHPDFVGIRAGAEQAHVTVRMQETNGVDRVETGS